jgi:hypothetical protein
MSDVIAATARIRARRSARRSRVPRSAWRSVVLQESDRIAQELERTDPADRGHPDYAIAERAVDRARELAREPSPPLHDAVWRFVTGQRSHQSLASGGAWYSLHRADEAVLGLQDTATLRARAREMKGELTECPFAADDPRCSEYRAILDRIGDVSAKGTIGPADREALRGVLRALNESAQAAHQNLKSFRSVLIGMAVVLSLAVVATCLVALADPAVLAACQGAGCTRSAETARFDAFEIALMGALGGLVSAVLTLRTLHGFRGPFGLYTAQSALKIPTGAGLAMIGVLFLQSGVLGAFDPQDGSQVFAYAAMFGFAQQVLTRLVDRRVADLIGNARSKDDGTPSPDRGEAPR